jgi:hypothetical protein
MPLGNVISGITGVIGLVVALITFLSTRTSLRAERAKVRQAELELEGTQRKLVGVRKTLEEEEIRHLMENIGCHGRDTCKEILCLWSCRSFEQAGVILERLDGALRGLVARPSADWLQQELRSVCDGALSTRLDSLALQPAGNVASDAQKAVYAKAIKCYETLLRWLNEDELQEAAADCIKWLNDERFKKDVASTLLPATLLKMPGDGDLLSKYKHLLADGEHATTAKERDIVIGALLGLATLAPTAGSVTYLALLEAGIQGVFKQWGSYGSPWCGAAHGALDRLEELGEKPERQLGELSGRLAGYIKAQGNGILQEKRKDEYKELHGVIFHIHRALGSHRKHRPRNRYVVAERVEAVIDFGNEQWVTGNLVNFSLGDDIYHAGAWIVSGQVPSWPAESADSPQPVALKLEAYNLKITVKNALVTERPVREPEGMGYGFRLHLLPDPSERGELATLAKRYPLTR